MSHVLFGMQISLDGFVNDRNGSVAALYPDFAALINSAYMQDTIEATGAVVMGRHSYEMGDPDEYLPDYEFQVPIFVLTHHVPTKMPKQSGKLTVTFVTDGVESAINQAKAAADDKQVTVIGGASLGQQLLNAGLVDELEIGIVPVVLGDGLRLFENLDPTKIHLEPATVFQIAGVTYHKYRVIK